MTPALSPRICVVAAMMGRHPGSVISQGEILAGLLAEAGASVVAVSSKTNRYHRLLDIAQTLVRRCRAIDVQCLSVYGGPSFIVEDVASLLSRLFGHRIILHLHGGALPEFFASYPRWSRRVLARADAIVTPSTYLARAVAPYTATTPQVIPNIIDLSVYPYRHRSQLEPRLLWMRTFHPIYNPMMALRVLQRVREKIPEATLVMAGQDRGLLPQVREQARAMGLEDAVRFPGFLDRAGKQREFNAADVFLNTNHIDNMPVGVVEAAACGLAVVAARVGGIPDLLEDGRTGLLVADNDDAAMASAIERLLREPGLGAHLSREGRELAERCSWEQVHPQWEALFEQLVTPSQLSPKEIR